MSTVLAGVFLLGVLVFVHELGHFWVAKATGVRVLTFSLGFGPRLFGFRRGDTDYRVSLVPLGGYVRMYGDDPTEEVPEEERDRSFLHKAIPQKSAIAFAGPFANFLLPVLLFFFLFVGTEQVPTARIGTVFPGEPAATAGLVAGDRILSIDGAAVADFTEVQEKIEVNPGVVRTVEVERGGDILSLQITPRAEKPIDPLQGDAPVGRVGIMPAVRLPFIAVAPGSPAAQAGLLSGDRIEQINGAPVASIEEAMAALAANPSAAWQLQVRSGALPAPRLLPVGHPDEADAEAPEAAAEQVRTVDLPPVEEAAAPAGEAAQLARSGVTEDELAAPALAQTLADTRERVAEALAASARLRGIARYDGTLQAIAYESVAERLGVKAGDRVVAVDGQALHIGQALSTQLFADPDGVHVVGLLSTAGVPRLLVFRMEGGKKHGEEDFKSFGVYPAGGLYGAGEMQTRQVGPGEALTRALEKTWGMMRATVRSFGMLLSGKASFSSLGGPITIVSFAGQAAAQGLSRYIELMAFISVNLGIVNLLPVPVLDGGHLLMFAIEGVTRRRLDLKTRERATKIGFFFLLILIVGALVNDFLRLL